MKVAVNNSHVRAINQRTVLDAIFQRESVSKAELARMLSMSKPAMTDNVNELLQIGIVKEIGEGTCGEGGGRKPMLLSFNSNFKYIVVVDFYYQQSIFALSNIKGEILNWFSIQQTPLPNFNAWVTMSENAISTLLVSHNIANDDLAAIAVSAPGIVSTDTNRAIIKPLFGSFDAEKLGQSLRNTFHAPIIIKNSTNAAAIGELYSGVGRSVHNLVYVSCGQGVGSGIVINRHLYEGRQAAAGEIGNFITPQTLTDGGTLESRICIQAILEKINTNMVKKKQALYEKKIEFNDMLKLWEQGDPTIIKYVEEIGNEIGCAICNLISTLNCDLVILGGEYLAFNRQILPQINKIVEQHSVIPVPVVASTLQDHASGCGLIAMCRELYFDKVCGKPEGAKLNNNT